MTDCRSSSANKTVSFLITKNKNTFWLSQTFTVKASVNLSECKTINLQANIGFLKSASRDDAVRRWLKQTEAAVAGGKKDGQFVQQLTEL